MTSNTVTVDRQQIDALIERVEHAIEHGLSITSEDATLLLKMLYTLLTLNDKLADKDVTIAKLRKLAGLVSQSEAGGRNDKGERARKGGRDRKNKNGFAGAGNKPEKTVHRTEKHALCDHHKGDVCPECELGKLYKVEPATFVRITGEAPLTATRHILEQLRCNACGAYFTAQLSDEARTDGAAGQQYGYSARAMMAIAK